MRLALRVDDFARVEDRHHADDRLAALALHFALEARQHVLQLVGRDVVEVRRLDRHLLAGEAFVVREQHLGHCARADQSFDPVTAQQRPFQLLPPAHGHLQSTPHLHLRRGNTELQYDINPRCKTKGQLFS
jgi:hypothetical protein